MQRHLSFAALLRLFMGYQRCIRQPGSPDCIAPHFYPPRHYYLPRTQLLC